MFSRLFIIIVVFDFFIRYADLVSIDEEVLVHGNGELTPAKVINVSTYKTQGNHYDFILHYFSLNWHECMPKQL